VKAGVVHAYQCERGPRRALLRRPYGDGAGLAPGPQHGRVRPRTRSAPVPNLSGYPRDFFIMIIFDQNEREKNITHKIDGAP
jgi:hypothetical protein